ncbi:MAG: NAD-dependent epimerase/dehydratase family protein [Pseudomonadota bacterium]|nr:NAD-dependent epimerase/dehydratase family protein [Pseudomonadota bacterium]
MDSKKPNLIVTGSTGRIGSALLERFKGKFNLIGFDREMSPHPPPFAECVCVDFGSDKSVQLALRRVREGYGKRIASVIHLAAYYDLSGEASPKYQEITVRGTERLLKGLQEFEAEQFVYASTMLVHAPCEPGCRINEDSPLEPKWAYPQSKAETEQLIKQQRGSVPVVILRLAGIYDEEGNSTFLTEQMARIYEKKLVSHFYPGDLNRGQSMLHMDDLLDGLFRLVDKRNGLPPELTLLMGEEETVSYGELQRDFGRLIHNGEWETKEIAKPLAKAGAWVEDALPGEDPFIKPWMVDLADDHYALDISRAKDILGWAPKLGLRTMLPKMVAMLKANPLEWYKDNKLEPPTELAAAAPAPHDEQMKMVEHGGAHEMAGMNGHEHGDMMREEHRKMLWPHYANIVLGLWLVTSPFALGYMSDYVPDANVLRVMKERNLPSVEWRNLAMAWSDMVSGALIVIFGMLAASPSRRYSWSQWASAAVGFWLLFAPLVFWTPLPEAYNNGTLVGALVIAFSVLIPMMPGMSMEGMMGGPDIPPGWNYTPSSWLQRLPIAALAVFGIFISRYLTAYQLGHIDRAWDPFFGDGTMTIITSEMSKAWPIADAGVGTVAYVMELLMAVMGDKRRWRTMPWMVLGFIVLVVPLGGVSIFFIIVQPIVIGTWCSLCLIAALAMAIMIPYSLDEFVAMGQFMLDAHRKGKALWRTFWMGDAMDGGSEDNAKEFAGTTREMIAEGARGVTVPAPLVLSIAIGISLMFTRMTFDNSGSMASSDHLVGALVVTFSIIAWAEVARPVRFVNMLFGAWLLAAPWLLDGVGSSLAVWNSVASGALLIVLAIPRGPVRNFYGSWDRYVF